LRRFALLVMLWIILSCTSSASQAEDYLIKPGDSLGVTVLGEAELTRRVVVSPQGSITLPLVNEVRVADLTTSQAAQQITAQLRRFLKNPQVSLELLEPAKMQVTVSGEVRSPGIYTVAGGARLLDAITAAGGYTPTADMSRIAVSHAGDSGAAVTVDLGKFLLSGAAGVNIPISAGDTIVVPTRESAVVGTVTILGAVRQSGQHPIVQGTTLREAIMLAGGPTEIADLGSVTLRREGSADTVRFDYARAASGDASANPELKPGDVIYVAAREQFGYFTIQGAVARPGRYEITGRTSITEAIAIAGGVGNRARLNDVRILRSPNGKTETIRANLSQIMVGQAENVPVQNADHVFVAAGKERPDMLRIVSLAVSLGWLLTRR